MLQRTWSRTWSRRALRVAALSLVGAVGWGTSSCSLIIDKDADQCQSDDDCGTFAGTTCQSGVCIAAECTTLADCAAFPDTICKDNQCVPSSEGCATTAQCIQEEGDYHVCRKDTGSCASLQGTGCSTVLGDYTDENAIIFGAIMPLTGDSASTGLALVDSIKLTLADFQRVNNLPPPPGGSGQRPIVVVACDDQSDNATGVAVAEHLVGEVGVQAIIGAAYSGISIDIATEVTVPAGVLLFSPSATSTSLTNLNDDGLVWRTSPSDIYQAAALKKYVPTLEAQIRTDRGLMPGDKLKLAILYKGDAYGNGLAKALQQSPVLQVNGAAVNDGAVNAGQFVAYDYGNPDDPKTDPLNYAQRVSETIAFAPDIVLVLGTTEGVKNVFEPIEKDWLTGPRPTWVFSDGGEVSDLDVYIGNNNSLRLRVTGTVPGTNNTNFQTFRTYYENTYTDGTKADTFGTAGAYDITYLLGYSVIALGDQPLTGANFNTALQNFFTSGQLIKAGDDPTDAFQQLRNGSSIDFDGASGTLKFNPDTGEAPSDIQIWCVTKDGAGKADGERNSGLSYIADNDALAGSINPAICE